MKPWTLKSWLLPRPWRASGAGGLLMPLAETAFLTVAGLLLALWLNPADPLFTRSRFPWIWFAPVLLALRYGVLPGVTSATLLLGAWLAGAHYGLIAPAVFPKLYFLGGLLLVMVCGEYSDAWRTRLRRQEEMRRYLEERLESLANKHYLLRVSHDRLEQSLITRPTTLRDALGELRALTVQAGADAGPLPGAPELLRLLERNCQLTRAALYRVEGGRPLPEPVAALGEAAPLDAGDALVAYALEHDALAHVNTDELEKRPSGAYLIVSPLKSARGETVGLLTVADLPFFALHHETLQTLVALLGYYADSVSGRGDTVAAAHALPGAPRELVEEVAKLARIEREVGVVSVLAVLSFRRPQPQRVAQIERMGRKLDLVWRTQVRGDGVVGDETLFVLMPLAGTSAAEGYFFRLEHWMEAEYGESLPQAGVLTHAVTLSEITAGHEVFGLPAGSPVPAPRARPPVAEGARA